MSGRRLQNASLIALLLALAGFFLTQRNGFVWAAFVAAIPAIWKAIADLLGLFREQSE